MYQRNRPLIWLFLVVELVLDQAGIDEVAHICARVPSNVIRIDVHLSQILDHLILICDIGLGSRSGGSNVRGSHVVVRV